MYRRIKLKFLLNLKFIKVFSKRCLSKIEDHGSGLTQIRNIGVIAHVDAGKTTTTERMLYYSGYTTNLGNVDEGNTIMDYMAQERERGITITSAAITFNWKNHTFNLIDTPGHIDFSFEVERSLRVLDGAIAIIDASAGVEPQTLTVWNQSTKYMIPRIAFVNKMDKAGADYINCLKSIEKKLKTVPISLQMPIGKEKSFTGVIDLINMKKLVWSNLRDDWGKSFETSQIDSNDEFYEEAFKNRLLAIERLAQVNDEFGEILLDKFNLNLEKMNDNILFETYLRKSCLKCTITPVFCGSSLKNRAVQPLMDAIIKYLPNPSELEKNNFQKYYGNNLVAICFKTIHDHQKSRKRVNSETSIASLQTNASSALNKSKVEEQEDDILTYVRVYNGELSSKLKVFNPNKKCKEICEKIYIPYSNQIKPVSKVTAGNIAVVNGLTKTITGDFLVTNEKVYNSVVSKYSKTANADLTLSRVNMDIPPPVFFCTVEPETDADEKRLNFALQCLQREDPSLKWIFNDDENLGQTILQGMGELQLEIIKDRILREYKLKAYFGPLNISYKEMPTKPITECYTLRKDLGDKKITIEIGLSIYPKQGHTFESVKIINSAENNLSETVTNDFHNAIDHGIVSALNRGVLLRYPIVNTDVHLNRLNCSPTVSLPYISSAAFTCTMNALKQSECVVIQPVMKLDITIPNEFSPRVHNDLNRRKCTSISMTDTDRIVNIQAKVPLSQLGSYSSEFRKLSSGNGTFAIEFDSYDQLTQKEYNELLNKKKF